MAVTISRDNVFFAFSPQLKAIARIEQGQEVLLKLYVYGYLNRIRSPGLRLGQAAACSSAKPSETWR